MKDGRVRRAVKRVALWRYNTDLAISRWIRRWRGDGPTLEMRGGCTGCGACCDTPTIQMPTALFFLRSVRWLVKAWHLHVNGFRYIGIDRRNRLLIFSCTHLDPVTRACDSYDSRPGMCRDYPVNLLEDVRPTFLPACGYYALAPDAEAIRADLAELAIPEARREYVERTFYVWEPPPGVAAWHPDPDDPGMLRERATQEPPQLTLVPPSPDSDERHDPPPDGPTPPAAPRHVA